MVPFISVRSGPRGWCDEGAPSWKSDEKQPTTRFLGKLLWTDRLQFLGQTSSADCLLDLHNSTGGDNSNVGGIIALGWTLDNHWIKSQITNAMYQISRGVIGHQVPAQIPWREHCNCWQVSAFVTGDSTVQSLKICLWKVCDDWFFQYSDKAN